ncbi:MAG: TIGR01777 family oxidoreductase [Chthoniobacteraceae bacterium]
MKIIIPGGTGQVGHMLTRAFMRDGHEVVILTRTPSASSPARMVLWDAKSPGNWISELEGADVVINLAGRSVNCRYTPANRREITQSRVDSTRAIGLAIRQAARPPRVWLQASTATIYAHRYDAPNDEATGILGGSEPHAPDTWRFSIDVATAWEKAATATAPLPRTRQVLLRSAITMSPDHGGAFDILLGLVRHGLGGASGNGRQYVSWIHETDFIRAIYWLIAHEDIGGPVNLAAPTPLPNAAFMRALRQAWGIRFGLPAAAWMLEIGAIFLKTETELILKSRRVTPGRLLHEGFTFTFPAWPEAARDLCNRWRESHHSAS